MSFQHILIIGTVWPEPNSSAAGSRLLQLIEVFQKQNWKISFTTAAQISPHAFDLTTLQIDTYHCELNNVSFNEFLGNLNPDMVIFDRFITEEQYGWRVREICPDALRVLDTIDLHCLRHARELALKEKRKFQASDLLQHDMALREIASIYRCDISLMISEVEMQILQETFHISADLLHYCAFMLPPRSEEEKASLPPFGERQHFVSIGNFLHAPNWDAVKYLKTNIWPGIRKKLPKAECHIYGAYVGQKALDLHKEKEGFLIKGRAEDLKAVMSAARVCLAPLRFGAGIKGKLLDSMIYGTPNVTSNIGAESMHGNLPWNGFICDQDDDFIEKAVLLYQDETTWNKLRSNGFEIIEKYFEPKLSAEKLVDKLRSDKTNLKQKRSENFIGKLLQHHQFASNKYMALWIEAKNKIPTAGL